MRRRLLALSGLSLVACSTAASNAPPAPIEARGEPLFAAVQARPAWKARLGSAHDGERRGALTTTLPADARAATRLDAAGRAIEIRAAATRATEALPAREGAAYADAAPATDLLWLRRDDRAEELRVLRAPEAPTTFRYDLHAVAGVAGFRLRRGVVEAYAEGGAVAFAMEIPWAVDANGVERPVQLSLETHDGGATLETRLDATGLAYPVLVDPAWSTPATMPTYLIDGIPYPLQNGDFVARTGSTLQSVVLYRAATDAWSNSAAWIDTGVRVSAYGASQLLELKYVSSTTSTATIVDPYTGTRTATTPPPSPNAAGGSAQQLSNGTILVVGGNSATSTSYLFTPSGPSWSVAGTTIATRSYASITPVGANALVLPFTGSVSYGELWTPGSGFTNAGAPTSAARSGRGVAISSTQVLFIGGMLNVSTAGSTAVDLYTVGAGWTSKAPMAQSRSQVPAALVAGGRVLVAGGRDDAGAPLSAAEVYDPTRNVWLPASPLSVPRGGASAASLSGGRALVAGGAKGAGTSGSAADWDLSSEIFTPQPQGTTCTLAGDCATGACESSVCCDKPACTGDYSCTLPGKIGQCLKKPGVACTIGAECGTGICADGVCCDGACTGACEACNLAATKGTCTVASAGSAALHGSCPAGAGCAAEVCNGTDRAVCHYVPTTTTCSADACTGGYQSKQSLCDGNGACTDVPTSCGAYACGATTCKTSCGSNADCASGYVCNGSTCSTAPGLGNPCTGPAGCLAPLTCVDGFCCGSASCPTGTTCGYPGKEGTCVGTNGSTCDATKMGADCGSGHCADGVCCDSACDGQCEACDVPDPTTSRLGKCIPIKGTPHGTRAACASDPSNPCSAAQCDGSTRTSCAGFVGSATTCREASCVAGVYTSPASCNGMGSCPSAVTNTCDGYACTADGKACKTQCSTDDDCASDYSCKAGKCAKKTAFCSDDRQSSTGLDGTTKPCAPYLCDVNGECASKCTTTSDCATGYACDVTAMQCTPAASEPTASSGGCALGGRGGSVTGAAFALAGMLGMAARRARKRR